MKLKELREKRAQLAGEIQRFRTEKLDPESYVWTAEDETNWTKLNRDYDDNESRIEKLERADFVSENNPERRAGRDNYDGRQSRGEQPTERDRSLAMTAWARHQFGLDLEDEHQAACQRVGLNPARRNLDLQSPSQAALQAAQRAWGMNKGNAVEARAAMSAYLGSTGGYLAPETFLTNLEINMLAFGGIRQVADMVVTGTGERTGLPTADDTGNSGVMLGESQNLDNSGAGGPTPSMGRIYWDAYKFSSQVILVPYELLEDDQFELPAMLGDMTGERLGRITSTKFTLGSGNNEPKGIVTAASLGVTAAGATAITADEVIDLEHSVNPAYRTGGSYAFHDNILLYLRKLKDGNGRYLWQSAFDTGSPNTLNNRPYVIFMEMDSTVATGKKTLLFGQMNKYRIRRVNSFRVYRLEERYRDQDQDGFVVLLREDGNLVESGTPPVKYLQQA